MKYREEIYLERNGEKIYGEKLPVIIHVNDEYNLTKITVFKNGLIQSFWGLISLEKIISKIKEGKLLQNIPDNVELECDDFGTIQSAHFAPEKSESDFVKEIEDIINEFNKLETRHTICESAYKTYLIEPSASNLTSLQDKYNDLPSHQKVIFEYVDIKDPLCCFMTEGGIYTLERRKELLKIYFKFEF